MNVQHTPPPTSSKRSFTLERRIHLPQMHVQHIHVSQAVQLGWRIGKCPINGARSIPPVGQAQPQAREYELRSQPSAPHIGDVLWQKRVSPIFHRNVRHTHQTLGQSMFVRVRFPLLPAPVALCLEAGQGYGIRIVPSQRWGHAFKFGP